MSEIERQEPEILAYRKMYDCFQFEIKNFEQRLIDLSFDYKASQEASAIGLQNVFNKFIELESRMKDIEILLSK